VAQESVLLAGDAARENAQKTGAGLETDSQESDPGLPGLPERAEEDPGYYLLSRGRPALESRLRFRVSLRIRLRRFHRAHALVGYLGTIAVFTALLLSGLLFHTWTVGAGLSVLVLMGILGLVPASEIAVSLVHRLVPILVPPRLLPKLELPQGVPPELRTLVVVPMLLTSHDDVEEQPGRSLKKNLKELPRACDVGTKKNAKGYKQSWIGYKLHLDVVDGDIPVAGILTSASLHDSQVSIPLAQMTATRVTSLYELMDAAYDAPEIHAFNQRLGHVPIIDHDPRRGGVKKQMDPPEKHRYKERSSAERVNSNLKDNYGGRHVRVRVPKKVACHLMFGLVALTATRLFNLLL